MVGLFLPALTAGCLSPQHLIDSEQSKSENVPMLPAAADQIKRGKVLMLPGAVGTTWHLAGFGRMVRERHPGFEVERRGWGVPMLSVHNLQSYERNRRTARELADELAAYRHDHPEAVIDVLGYSGGGGMAIFAVEALPLGVMIDRLILVAPAISCDYPLEQQVLPHVRGFIVNYASARDLHVGWGTRTFGTMDRVKTVSAGYSGFELEHPRLLQLHWDYAMVRDGHWGNHRSYLMPDWQHHYLLPALDPAMSIEALRDLIERRLGGDDPSDH